MRSDDKRTRIDRGVGIDVVRLTEGAARLAAAHVGRGDEADVYAAALKGFRRSVAEVNLDLGEVFGDFPEDEARSLKGGKNPAGAVPVDIAAKPVECLTASAIGGRNALSAVVVAPRGTIRPMPRVYMEKIACTAKAAPALDLTLAPADLVTAVAHHKGVPTEELLVTILDRARNRAWIDGARAAGARVRLIADGDLAAAIAAAVPDSGVDLLVGSGGAFEGWLAAAALRGLGGAFVGRFLGRHAEDKRAVVAAGFADPDAPFGLDQLLPPEFVFSATGITDGDVLRGVRFADGRAIADSLMVRTTSETVRWIRSERPLRAVQARA